MDSFTQQMMSRATSRRVEFEQHLTEILTVDEGIDDPNLEDFLENKRREYREILRNGRSCDPDDKGESDFHSDEEDENVPVSSYRRRPEPEQCELSEGVPPGKLSAERSKRLARLANVINNWEDESDKKLPTCKRSEAPLVKPVVKPASSPALKKKICNFEGDRSRQPKGKENVNKVLDDRVLQNLEMQGFQRCDSNQQRLVFDYKSPQKTPTKSSPSKLSPKKVYFGGSPHKSPESTPPARTSPVKSPLKVRPQNPESVCRTLMQETLPVKVDNFRTSNKSAKVADLGVKKVTAEPKTAVSTLAAKYENESPTKRVKDPAELSLAERKAIFERNNGAAILPKAPFGMPVPAKLIQKPATKVELKKEPVKDVVTQAVLERQREIEMLRTRWERKREENVVQGGPTAQMPPEYRSPERLYASSPKSPVRHPVEISLSSPPKVDRSLELKSPKKSPFAIGNSSIHKRIKVSPPKPGRIYPSISDIETESEFAETESEAVETDLDRQEGIMEESEYETDESSTSSLGQLVVQRARLSQVNLKRGMTTSSPRSSSSSSLNTSAQESRIIHEMDDFLDEALGGASPPKRSRESLYEVEVEKPKVATPLVHTVSTYRKLEAQRVPKTESCDMTVDDVVEDAAKPESVQERISELEQEMIKQMTIISQASQALNLCQSRPEFVGSAEQVEAEKLLLLATTRRVAAQHEVERLKVERTLSRGGASKDKGSLTIEYISLPIKMCPTEPDKTDYFLCLATSGVTVLSTQVLALKKQNLSRGNRLAFIKPITFENLCCDFTVTIEVYRLTCKNAGVEAGASDNKEEKKSTLATKLGLTPQKKCANRRNRMPIESPGGPNIVRSPSFKMVGFVVFSLRDVRKNKFTLNKVPYGVCLDGTIELSMSSALKSEVEHRGFLTQFEEVSGFGAWKRKWAHLKGSSITFWLYPEHEEQNKIPIDTIDLSIVKNKEIGLVSREVCARPHTVLLETYCGEQKLLSADTLEDRLAWTKAINKSLQLIKAWGGRSY